MSLNFNSTFGNKDVSVNCPLCKKELKIKLNQVGSIIQCTYCKKTIELKAGNSFSSSKKSVNKSFKDLEKTLKNFGK